MLFNSLHFLIFFPLILLLIKHTPKVYRKFILLVSSYYFYISWKAEYILLILLSTFVDYFISKEIAKSNNDFKRKIFLIVSLVLNLGLLSLFKYYDFVILNLNSIFDFFSVDITIDKLNLILPVGISFYTFQTLSYTIDVYRKKIDAESDFLTFALYVSFWPQLVAGPIERAKSLLPQLKNKIKFESKYLEHALTLLAFGFFKKIVIADRVGIYVDQVYNNPNNVPSLALLFATYFFAIQIYCDFSGYTDIARGCAKLIGIDLMENFRQPYFSGSVTNFWKRWHISLTTWFTEYLFIPLGGSRVSRVRIYFNYLVVFLVSGLWHGANWTFIVWGGLHCLYLIIEKAFNVSVDEIRKFSRISSIIRIFITFHLTLLAWIFFRADSLDLSFSIIKRIFTAEISISTLAWSILPFSGDNLAIDKFLMSLLFILLLFVVDYRRYIKELSGGDFKSYSIVIFLIVVIVLFGEFYRNSFIYFQF